MRKFFFALTLLSFTVSPAPCPATAQRHAGGTEGLFARRLALLPPVMDQGDFIVLACLQQNRPNLTKACNQVLMNHGQ